MTVYYHMVLEAKLVTEAGLVISLATEFIPGGVSRRTLVGRESARENADPEATKQDCELGAFYRLAAKLKTAFPQTRICLLLDSLYMAEPVIRTCRENRLRMDHHVQGGLDAGAVHRSDGAHRALAREPPCTAQG